MMDLISKIYSKAVPLTKLKISKVDLNDFEIVDTLCDIMSVKFAQFVHHIELSHCHFTPKHLAKIMSDVNDYCG